MHAPDTRVDDRQQSWQRTLSVIWVSQFFSMASFAFGMPFAAYYIQALGVQDRDEVRFWTAIFQGAAPLVFGVAAPLWGRVSDRYGRKLMLVRAQVCAVLVLLGMGLAPSIGWLIVCRLGQGMFTGTMTAAQTLVSVSTPQQRHGLALGALSSAVYAGSSFGMAMGGWCADQFGYRTSFLIAAGLSAVSVLLVAVGTRERFVEHVPFRLPKKAGLPLVLPGMPLLVLIGVTSVVANFSLPILPLLVQELVGGLQGAATTMGNLAAVGTVASMLAGLLIAPLTDRFAPTRVALWSALAAALFCLPFAHAYDIGLAWLFAAQFALMFAVAGLDPIFQIWLSRVSAPQRRGAVFGWSFTARSIGWMLGPLSAAALAGPMGLTGIFYVMAIGFIVLIPVARWAARRMQS